MARETVVAVTPAFEAMSLRVIRISMEKRAMLQMTFNFSFCEVKVALALIEVVASNAFHKYFPFFLFLPFPRSFPETAFGLSVLSDKFVA
ncbi:MAG TPA: hypothetical protein VGC39_04810 [Candidatus Methylacidiphilales bacterium]